MKWFECLAKWDCKKFIPALSPGNSPLAQWWYESFCWWEGYNKSGQAVFGRQRPICQQSEAGVAFCAGLAHPSMRITFTGSPQGYTWNTWGWCSFCKLPLCTGKRVCFKNSDMRTWINGCEFSTSYISAEKLHASEKVTEVSVPTSAFLCWNTSDQHEGVSLVPHFPLQTTRQNLNKIRRQCSESPLLCHINSQTCKTNQENN